MAIRRAIVLIILVLILLLQVALRWPFLSVPLERDEGAYGYVAQRILAGELPYRDAFDHKPPVIYYLYASFIYFGGNTVAAIRAPALVWSLLTTLALFWLGRLLFGSTAGLVAAFFFAVFSGGVLVQGTSANTEVFMVLPLVLSLIFFLFGLKDGQDRAKVLIVAGLFGGLAMMIKQTAAVNLAVMFLFFFSRQDGKIHYKWRPALALLAGALIVPAVFSFYFLVRGAWPDYLCQVLIVNRRYISSLDFGPVARLAGGLYTTYIFAKLENGVLWLLALIGLAYILLEERTRENAVLAAWTLASVVGLSASGLFFGHYYLQLIPALCLLAAYAVKKVWREAGLAYNLALAVLLLWLFLPTLAYQAPFYFSYSSEQIANAQYGKPSYSIAKRLADKLAPRLRSSDRVLVWAADPEVYFYLNKKAPTRYFSYLRWLESRELQREISAGLISDPPDYIIWTDYNFAYPELLQLLRERYQLDFGIGSWRVYKRKR
ncbi:MAG: glycosyltransferase family 39 protein [Candidatus Saganbacteria bacterium]|nr:glycosyltransferase family 39 protein [Candidatus Saganbacteria bacterium]